MSEIHSSARNRIERLAERTGMQVAGSLETFSELALRWSARVQLTAARDLETFVDRHLADSVEVALRVPEVQTLVDVGSGGGLPGLVIAICRPEIQVTLLEPIRKKQAFLAHARRTLGLSNVVDLGVRDTEFLESAEFVLQDACVSRAVWSLEEWLVRGATLVRPGGWILGMEARDRVALPDGAERLEYSLPDGRQRALIRMRRSS